MLRPVGQGLARLESQPLALLCILLKMREKSESREVLVKSGSEFIEARVTWEIVAKLLLRSGVYIFFDGLDCLRFFELE